MSDNGTGPAILVDLNRVTRREFREFRAKLAKIKEEDIDARESIVADFYVKVISEWPYTDEITADNYLSLGLLDSQRVDEAVTEAVNALTEKK